MANRPLRVLFAEDDDEDWFLITDLIRECPFGVHMDLDRVKDGQQLLDRLRDRRVAHPDLVLLDIKMPRKDGLETLKDIRGDEELKAIPVIILTTSDAESDILRSFKAGANSYVVKPAAGVGDLLNALRYYWTKVSRIPQPREAKEFPS